jgi:hypothetical protein
MPLACPAAPEVDALTRQICLLSDAIDRNRALPEEEYSEDREVEWCAQFRALQWARSPSSFSPPLSDPVTVAAEVAKITSEKIVSLALFRAVAEAISAK